MNKKETGTILGVLRAAYPSTYAGMSRESAIDIVNLWQEMFASDDVADVAKAVKALIATRKEGYPPTIGEIRSHLVKVTQPTGMSADEAWALVFKAVCRSTYHSTEEFEKLPAECQRIVGSANQLRTWAMMDTQTLDSVISSNFMKSYRARATQTEFEAKLPPDLKRLIADVGTMPRLTDEISKP